MKKWLFCMAVIFGVPNLAQANFPTEDEVNRFIAHGKSSLGRKSYPKRFTEDEIVLQGWTVSFFEEKAIASDHKYVVYDQTRVNHQNQHTLTRHEWVQISDSNYILLCYTMLVVANSEIKDKACLSSPKSKAVLEKSRLTAQKYSTLSPKKPLTQ
ncbi:MAG: hypothetical protein ACPGXY_04515 [Alphaproteobacteria bacterium]